MVCAMTVGPRAAWTRAARAARRAAAGARREVVPRDGARAAAAAGHAESWAIAIILPTTWGKAEGLLTCAGWCVVEGWARLTIRGTGLGGLWLM